MRLDVTGADGAATFLYLTVGGDGAARRVRAAGTQPAGRDYLAARSRTEIVTPHVALTTPSVPAVVDRAALVTIAGDLTPHHPAGEHSVELVLQRRGEGGRG